MKKLLVLLMCAMLLTGCGQKDTETNSTTETEQTEVNETVTEESDSDVADSTEESFDEEYSEEADDGMMDYTVYTGDVVSVAYDGLTTVALDAEQVIPVDSIEFVLSDGTSFNVPAASIPESISDYDNLVSTGAVSVNDAERYSDYIQKAFVSFVGADWYTTFFMDNESNEDVVDGTTLPVTKMQVSFDTPITINGFLFDYSTFVINDLVEVWGHPLFAQVDTGEGSVRSVDYYWRFNDGYVKLVVEEGLEMLLVYQWDTYTANDYYMTDRIPRLEQ